MDAITYIRSMRLAPTGELLTPTEKLTLILLALGLDQAGEIIPEIDRLAEYCLLVRRSMFRVLASLELKGCLQALPQVNEKGQSAPTMYRLLDERGRVLLPSPSTAGRVLRMTGESDTRGGGSVNRDTLAPPNAVNSLAPPPSGTRLAVLPPPPNSVQGEGAFAVPAARVWAEIMRPYGVEITLEVASLIADREPKNLEAWRETLKGWVAAGWGKLNIDGQLERYNKTLKRPEYAAQGNKPSPSQDKSTEEQEEEARHRQQIYGDQTYDNEAQG